MATSTSESDTGELQAESALQPQALERVFQHDSLELPDPDPEMTPEQVREHFATQFPELSNAQVTSEGISNGQQVFSFERSIGTKG